MARRSAALLRRLGQFLFPVEHWRGFEPVRYALRGFCR